jgi:hypothetical protein
VRICPRAIHRCKKAATIVSHRLELLWPDKSNRQETSSRQPSLTHWQSETLRTNKQCPPIVPYCSLVLAGACPLIIVVPCVCLAAECEWAWMGYPSKLSLSIISTYRGVRVLTNLHWLPPCFPGDYQTGREGVHVKSRQVMESKGWCAFFLDWYDSWKSGRSPHHFRLKHITRRKLQTWDCTSYMRENSLYNTKKTSPSLHSNEKLSHPYLAPKISGSSFLGTSVCSISYFL